jgi:predicted nucleic acid-binding protein
LTLVVDSNVALKWVLEEEGTDQALQLLTRTLLAPELLQAEVGNTLTKRVRGRELVPEQAVRAFDKVMTLVRLVSGREFGQVALELSLALNHSIYDCYFLAAAEKHGPLVTADGVFATKVRATRYGRLIYLLGEEIPVD